MLSTRSNPIYCVAELGILNWSRCGNPRGLACVEPVALIRAATFWPVPELQMPGQPNRDYRWFRVSSVMSSSLRGVRSSLCSWPIASDFIGSAFTCASWIRPHLVPRRGQCSNPERAEVICWISTRDWHFGQRGRPATRGNRVDVCGSGRCLRLNQMGRYRAVSDGCRNDAVIAAVCRLGV